MAEKNVKISTTFRPNEEIEVPESELAGLRALGVIASGDPLAVAKVSKKDKSAEKVKAEKKAAAVADAPAVEADKEPGSKPEKLNPEGSAD